MQYYAFELDDTSKFCAEFVRLLAIISTIAFPWVYLRPQIMEDLFRNFNEIDVYIDDIGVVSSD
jgi:hypothetical protein